MNVHARIDRLRAHLKTRRGRRDQVALRKLTELRERLEGRATGASIDALLRTYYDLERNNPLYQLPHPFFALLKKEDPNVPDGRAYVLPVSMEKPVSHQYDEDDPIRSKTTQKYREMYDTIDWGDHPARGENDSEPAEPAEPGDAIECTLKTYANVVAPLEAQFPVETYTPQIGDQCPLCETRTPIQTIDHDERIFECSDRVHSFDEL